MFIKRPAHEKSLRQRKPILGFGINDSNYLTNIVVDGKRVTCPIYMKWTNMLKRCYCPKIQARSKAYRDVTVCAEWLTFSKFSKWFELNNIDGYDLDKDIKIKGNKVYSPDTCLFVPPQINHLLVDCVSNRGDFPIGVSFNVKMGMYQAHVMIDGKSKYLGLSVTPESASNAYMLAKNEEIKRKCYEYPEFTLYLLQHLY